MAWKKWQSYDIIYNSMNKEDHILSILKCLYYVKIYLFSKVLLVCTSILSDPISRIPFIHSRSVWSFGSVAVYKYWYFCPFVSHRETHTDYKASWDHLIITGSVSGGQNIDVS